MKSKFSSIWRVAVALVLICSLGLVFSPAPVASANGFTVAITAPSEAFVCDTFPVTVTASATGDCYDDTVLGIVVTGDAEVVGDDSEWVGDICDGKSKSAIFMVKCTGPGTGTINASAIYNIDGCPQTAVPADPVAVTQTCRLAVAIDTPSGGTDFVESDTFSVTATVTNNTAGVCEDANVCLAIDGNASLVPSGGAACFNVGPIPAGDSQEVNWTVHCDDPGDVDLTVTATGCGQEGVCAEACADTIIINQLGLCGLDLVITSDPAGEVCVDSTYDIVGTVTNTGNTALTLVEARLTATGDYAAYVSIATSGWNPASPASLAPGETAAVSWTVTCTGRNDGVGQECLDQLVSFLAEAQADCVGTNDVTDSEVLNDWANQKYVIVTLQEPAVTCHDFCIDDEWNVDVAVQNCLDLPATGHISITVTGPAELNPSPLTPQDMNLLASTTTKLSEDGGPVVWHVKCTGPGNVTITVQYLGVANTTTLCDIDTAIVHQKANAQLAVDVVEPPCVAVCEEFDVTATVTNPGGTNAAPVECVTVTADPLTAGNATLVGSVVGPTGDTNSDSKLDQDETWVYTWTYKCNDYLNAHFSVTVEGEDPCDPGDSPDLTATDTSDTIQLDLGVNITSPDECAVYQCSDTFCVTALITNNDTDDPSITVDYATIEIFGAAVLADGETASKAVGVVTTGNPEEVSWTVHCTGPGPADIVVTAEVSSPCDLDFSDSVTVYQEQPPMEVEILSPMGEPYELQTTFDGTAEWRNDESLSGSWSVLLTAPPDLTGAGRIAIPYGQTLDTITRLGYSYNMLVGHGGIGWDAAPYIVLDLDTVGDGAADTWVVHHMFTDAVDRNEWTSWEITDDPNIPPAYWTTGSSSEHWHVAGDKSPGAYADWNAVKTTFDSDMVLKIKVAVGQWASSIMTAYYVDDIIINLVTYPVELNTYVATSQDFAVTARVTNAGSSVAYDIPVTIDPGANASVTGATQSIDRLDPGESATLTWTLHCEGQGADTISVSAVGLTTVADSVTIYQYPAAHLEVKNIAASESTVTVCEEFTVTADIFNTGEADAWEVTATLSVFPEGSARISENDPVGSYTKTVGTGTLVGHGQDGEAEVSWLLHCKEACDSTITITVEGYDEYGYHFKQVYLHDQWVDAIVEYVEPVCLSWTSGEPPLTCLEWTEGEWITLQEGHWLEGAGWVLCLEPEAGRAIDERFIEPASVTVKQEEPGAELSYADLAVEKLVNGEESITRTVNEDVTFTITVENLLGPSDATNIVVYDMLPEGVNFSSWSATQGFYYLMAGYWSVGDLAVGEDATLTIVATVNTVGEIQNLATVEQADQHDPITGNNADTVTITGEAAPLEESAEISLDAGYNLISLPLIPEDTDIVAMMSGLDFIRVSQYVNDGDPTADDWYYYNAVGPSDLDTMEDGWGYWVNMNTPGVITFDGYELAPPPPAMPRAYDVEQKWNLVGFKSTVPKLPVVYFAGIPDKYTIIYGFDAAWFIVGTPGHEFLLPKLGYWIALKADESGTIFP